MFLEKHDIVTLQHPLWYDLYRGKEIDYVLKNYYKHHFILSLNLNVYFHEFNINQNCVRK